MKLPVTPSGLIKAARDKASLNQTAFAKELETTQTLLSRYERGVIPNPPAKVIIRCANKLLESGDESTVGPAMLEEAISRIKNSGNQRLIGALAELLEAMDGGVASEAATKKK